MQRGRGLAIVCLLAALLIGTAAFGGGISASPDQLRALFVQRLVRYVTWPEGTGPKPDEPIIVAAVKPDALIPYFKGAEGGDRFRLVQWPTTKCHILVLTDAPGREVAAILNQVSGLPVLTVTQEPDTTGPAGVVNFFRQGNRLKLEIDPGAADRAGLTVSSRLLQLARIREGGSHD